MMVVLEHPITTDVVLVTTSDAKYFALIGNKSSAKLWNQKIIVKRNLLRRLLIDIIKMYVLRAPLKVMDELS